MVLGDGVVEFQREETAGIDRDRDVMAFGVTNSEFIVF
jgi:hypothetical protein